MRLKDFTGWILLALAIGVGVLAFFLIRHYLASQEEKLRLDVMSGRDKTVQVVVARRPLEAGAVVGPETMALGEIPKRHLPGRAVLPSEFDGVKDRVLTRPLAAGEPLLADFVAGTLIDRFSELLVEGERAVSIEVTALDSHAGMLVPGDYIDLFSIAKSRGLAGDKRIVPLIERIKVLAAGAEPLRAADQAYQHLTEKGARYSSVTVGVPAKQAERLILAQQNGDVAYLLRNANDKAMIMNFDAARVGAKKPGYRYYSLGTPIGEQRRIDDGAEEKAASLESAAGER